MNADSLVLVPYNQCSSYVAFVGDLLLLQCRTAMFDFLYHILS